MDAAVGSGPRKIKRIFSLECGTERPLAHRSRFASKIETGRIGKRRCPLRTKRAQILRRQEKKERTVGSRHRGRGGWFSKVLLYQFAATVLSPTIAVGHARLERDAEWAEIEAVCDNLDSPLRCVDGETETRRKAEGDNGLGGGGWV